MKLIVLRDNLKQGLDVVGRAIGQNLNLPILANILVSAEKGQIRLVATNLELTITKNISGKIIEEGGVIVSHQTISNIVNNSTSERINLETSKQGNLVVKGDNYEANLQLANRSEFPPVSEPNPDNGTAAVNSSTLRDALGKVVMAAEVSDLRPEISGVLFLGELENLKLVATDSFRLAEAKISGQQFENKKGEGFKFTLPLKAAQEITRVVKEGEEAAFHLEKNQFIFKTEDTTLISRLIEGSYPDYQAIIPKGIDTEVVISRNELSGALRLSSAFAGRTSDVKLRVKDKKVVEIYSSDSAIGENSYLIPAKITGPETEVSFNWRFLLDGLRGGTSENVFLGLNGNDRPAIIKNPEDESYFYILMPIKAD
ncbi:MAG: DNA polymerase III subunit beta [Candidatus Colwellbacteria bacterium]|nr:DNA polymerase III subunit beta [Candidatus Colwellbacteria bacterium]